MICSSRDIGHTLSFYPQQNLKNQNFDDDDDDDDDDAYHHFTHVHQNSQSYDKQVAEIQSETDRIFGHFGPFFALSLSNKPENQNFEKLKKAPEDVTILHLCTKNYDHMMYAS